MKNIRNLFIDLDGTLTDPKEGITKSIQYALEKMKAHQPSMDELEWCIGPPLVDAFSVLLDSKDDVLIQKAIDHYRDRYVDRCTIENTLYEGIQNTLEELNASGYQLYLATSKPWVYAGKILDHFNLTQYFTAIHGSELDGTRDYKQDLLAYILKQHDLSAAETVMIGDRSHDMVGANYNNIRAIGVTYGYGTIDELKNAGADFICHHHDEVRMLFT
jgi:phosphoglycolate phosphatase